jgi:hypothetical protein
VNEGMDARTWLTVIGLIVGFFLVPFAMLEYDRRRALRNGNINPGETSQTGIEPAASAAALGRHGDMTRPSGGSVEDSRPVVVVAHMRREPNPPAASGVEVTVTATAPGEPPLRASPFAAVRAQVVTIPGSAPKPTRPPSRQRTASDQESRP